MHDAAVSNRYPTVGEPPIYLINAKANVFIFSLSWPCAFSFDTGGIERDDILPRKTCLFRWWTYPSKTMLHLYHSLISRPIPNLYILWLGGGGAIEPRIPKSLKSVGNTHAHTVITAKDNETRPMLYRLSTLRMQDREQTYLGSCATYTVVPNSVAHRKTKVNHDNKPGNTREAVF